MAKRSFFRRSWDWIGNTGTLWWLVQVLAAPILGALTFAKGITESIPITYAITAGIVAAGGAVYLLNQLSIFFRRWREGYAYGVAYRGPVLGYNPDFSDAVIQLGVVILNVTDKPLRYTVKRFNVVVGNTTLPISIGHIGGFINRGTERHCFFPSFSLNDVQQYLGRAGVHGRISYEILYGHPDGPDVRLLEMDLEIWLNLMPGHIGARDVILRESDTRI
jgi:hypothetical protein